MSSRQYHKVQSIQRDALDPQRLAGKAYGTTALCEPDERKVPLLQVRETTDLPRAWGLTMAPANPPSLGADALIDLYAEVRLGVDGFQVEFECDMMYGRTIRLFGDFVSVDGYAINRFGTPPDAFRIGAFLVPADPGNAVRAQRTRFKDSIAAAGGEWDLAVTSLVAENNIPNFADSLIVCKSDPNEELLIEMFGASPGLSTPVLSYLSPVSEGVSPSLQMPNGIQQIVITNNGVNPVRATAIFGLGI